MRHVRIGQLWIQEVAEEEELRFRKIKGRGTHRSRHETSDKENFDDLIPRISLREAEGRADQSLRI